VNDLTIYDTLAESWWQAGSQLHMLARMNPARFAYFDRIVGHWQGLRVLDLGCGGGLTTTCLVQRGAIVVGVDLSYASLRVASCHARGHGHPKAVFACGQAESLPFADASFDVVWCTDVLEHLSDLPTAITQVARVLKPGALLVRYDQSHLAVPSTGDLVLGIPRWPGTTRYSRLALIYQAPGTPPSADPTRHTMWCYPWYVASLVISTTGLVFSACTLHGHPLPWLCRKTGRREQWLCIMACNPNRLRLQLGCVPPFTPGILTGLCDSCCQP
jgi:ubiquinone/menaquinone biosynthesis C-methylase UbiE